MPAACHHHCPAAPSHCYVNNCMPAAWLLPYLLLTSATSWFFACLPCLPCLFTCSLLYYRYLLLPLYTTASYTCIFLTAYALCLACSLPALPYLFHMDLIRSSTACILPQLRLSWFSVFMAFCIPSLASSPLASACLAYIPAAAAATNCYAIFFTAAPPFFAFNRLPTASCCCILVMRVWRCMTSPGYAQRTVPAG